MNRDLQIALADLESELAHLFVEYPELAEDEQLRADTVEGSTAVYDVLERILSIALDTRTMIDALKERARLIGERKGAAEKREQAMRTLALRIMNRAQIAKAQLTEATLSVRPVAPGVKILDEAAIPESFLRIKKELDRTAIKAALEAGQDVPGAALGNGGQTLAIRIA